MIQFLYEYYMITEKCTERANHQLLPVSTSTTANVPTEATIQTPLAVVARQRIIDRHLILVNSFQQLYQSSMVIEESEALVSRLATLRLNLVL